MLKPPEIMYVITVAHAKGFTLVVNRYVLEADVINIEWKQWYNTMHFLKGPIS